MKFGAFALHIPPLEALLMGEENIVDAVNAAALDFTTDRAGRTAKASGNGSKGTLIILHRHHDDSFLNR